jgi:hypothetical protein
MRPPPPRFFRRPPRSAVSLLAKGLRQAPAGSRRSQEIDPPSVVRSGYLAPPDFAVTVPLFVG